MIAEEQSHGRFRFSQGLRLEFRNNTIVYRFEGWAIVLTYHYLCFLQRSWWLCGKDLRVSWFLFLAAPHQGSNNSELIDGLKTVETSNGQTVVVQRQTLCGIYQAISFENVTSSSGDDVYGGIKWRKISFIKVLSIDIHAQIYTQVKIVLWQ